MLLAANAAMGRIRRASRVLPASSYLCLILAVHAACCWTEKGARTLQGGINKHKHSEVIHKI